MTGGPDRVASWMRSRTTRSTPADVARAADALDGRTVSVVVPARNEAATVAPVVEAALRGLAPLKGEVVVVDDASDDGTGDLARAAGADVVRCAERRGKGGALREGVAATSGDLVVFLDADVPGLEDHWIPSLVLPLLQDDGVVLVKAAYDRPLTVDGVMHPGSGGRVSRLVAVPALNLVAPELTGFAQPLAGETAVRRSLLDRVTLGDGYGIEMALLLDTYRLVGLPGLAQVDLGERAHRHHSDADLARMATSVLRVAARYAGWPVADDGFAATRRGPAGDWTHVAD